MSHVIIVPFSFPLASWAVATLSVRPFPPVTVSFPASLSVASLIAVCRVSASVPPAVAFISASAAFPPPRPLFAVTAISASLATMMMMMAPFMSVSPVVAPTATPVTAAMPVPAITIVSFPLAVLVVVLLLLCRCCFILGGPIPLYFNGVGSRSVALWWRES